MGRAARLRQARKQADQKPQRPVHYGYFLVGYVDLLGQRDEIRKLTTIPHSPESRPAVMDILKRTAGRVHAVRSGFDQYFRLAAQNRQQLHGLTPEQVREYNRMRTLTFHQVGFSDTFVISVPLIERDFGAATAALGVWAALFGTAGMFVASLATQIPLRAGIDIERGIDLFPNEVYGPALLSAYELESTVAQYPRAVLGSGVTAYLSYLEALPGTDRWSALARSLAADCRALITTAPDDGRPMLHMLAPQILNAGAALREPASIAYRWAKEQHETYRSASNQKLADYYERLLKYFNASGYTD